MKDRLAGRPLELPAALAPGVHYLPGDPVKAYGLGKMRPQVCHDAAYELTGLLLPALLARFPRRSPLQECQPQQADPCLNGHLIAEGFRVVERTDRPDLLQQFVLPGDLFFQRAVFRPARAHVGLHVFARRNGAGKAAQHPRMKVQAEVGGIRVSDRPCHVQAPAVHEEAFAFGKQVLCPAHLKIHASLRHHAELDLVVPVPVDVAQNALAHDVMVDRHREFRGAVLLDFLLIVQYAYRNHVISQSCYIFILYYDIIPQNMQL